MYVFLALVMSLGRYCFFRSLFRYFVSSFVISFARSISCFIYL